MTPTIITKDTSHFPRPLKLHTLQSINISTEGIPMGFPINYEAAWGVN